MLPVLYNNMKQIVQTEDHVMILLEMVHDARIVRLNSEHAPESVRRWYGDSIGWWEGDTLVFTTIGLRGEDGTILDRTGLILSDQAHGTTRLRLRASPTTSGCARAMPCSGTSNPIPCCAPRSGRCGRSRRRSIFGNATEKSVLLFTS